MPRSGFSKPTRTLSSEVFPAPDHPSTAVTPCGMVRETSRNRPSPRFTLPSVQSGVSAGIFPCIEAPGTEGQRENGRGREHGGNQHGRKRGSLAVVGKIVQTDAHRRQLSRRQDARGSEFEIAEQEQQAQRCRARL